MLGDAIIRIFGNEPPVAIRFPDGSQVGPADGGTTVVVRNDDAIRRVITGWGEIGLCRAYVAGDLDVEGDLISALDALGGWNDSRRVSLSGALTIAALLRRYGTRRPAIPPEEVRRIGGGRLHSTARDAAAIAHHYDISNEFYELVLGPRMCYSCAIWADPGATLEDAQDAKLDLVCRKLGLEPGMRMFDAGCGWGTLLVHAVRHYGVVAIGATLSAPQAQYARAAAAAAGVADRVEIRCVDYRNVEGSFDAISSVGMLEHVGRDLNTYANVLSRLLKPNGRFLHHAISQVGGRRERPFRPTVMSRYVFPDAALLEIGQVVSAFHLAGLEVRHLESLRDHYPPTLAAWLSRLESNWAPAVSLVGAPRARIWRLYMAGGLLNFHRNKVQIHQVLCVKPGSNGSSGMSRVPGHWRRDAKVSSARDDAAAPSLVETAQHDAGGSPGFC